jgi:hypothetical protein
MDFVYLSGKSDNLCGESLINEKILDAGYLLLDAGYSILDAGY